MRQQNFNYEEHLQKNFLDTSIHYLQFNIARHWRMAKLAGTPIRALIAEVIYWHESLILAKKGTDDPFETVRAEIAKTGRETLESKYKNRIKRYEMMEYKISNENVKDTTSKVLEIMENQNA